MVVVKIVETVAPGGRPAVLGEGPFKFFRAHAAAVQGGGNDDQGQAVVVWKPAVIFEMPDNDVRFFGCHLSIG
jgi:hypothetical protein